MRWRVRKARIKLLEECFLRICSRDRWGAPRELNLQLKGNP